MTRVTFLVTSRPPPQEAFDDVHDAQTLCPSVSSTARRPFGPSSGNQTAFRSRLSFAWSSNNCFFPVISGYPSRTVILSSSTNPTFFFVRTPSFDITCGTPSLQIDFLSLLVILYEWVAARCDNCLLLLPLVRIPRTSIIARD